MFNIEKVSVILLIKDICRPIYKNFLEDEVESNYPNDLNELMSNGNQADSEKHGILQNILDNVNTTQFNDREITLLTPEKHKVYVSDTPVEYYGLSMLERKIRGID